MSFGENLQYLRRKNNITQEELADKLEVTRQTVSKWEQTGNYPEMEKTMELCKMFSVSMDELLMGDVTKKDEPVVETEEVVKPKCEQEQYDKEFKRFSLVISLAVFFVALGVSLSSLFSAFAEASAPVIIEQSVADILAAVSLFVCISVCAILCIFFGVKHENFIAEYDFSDIKYDKEIKHKYSSRLAICLSVGVALIFVALIVMLCLSTKSEFTVLVGATIFILTIGIGAVIIIFSAMENSRVKVEIVEEEKRRKNATLSERIINALYPIIILIATAIYVGIGLATDNWKIAPIIYAVAGILCGVVAVIGGCINKK